MAQGMLQEGGKAGPLSRLKTALAFGSISGGSRGGGFPQFPRLEQPKWLLSLSLSLQVAVRMQTQASGG